MAFDTIRKSSAPEMVAEQILRKLSDGELEPGSQLPPQRELARMFGVGRSSVREAINALAVMGYLQSLQGRGTFIRDPLPSSDPALSNLTVALRAGSLLDLMEARELLECKSAELAAERAEASHIRTLEGLVEEMEASKGDYDRFLEADLAFHAELAEATGNRVIGEMTKLVLEKVIDHHSRLKTARLSPEYREASIASAREVAGHLAAGNGPRAADWMRLHLNAIRDELKTVLA
jgi:GntR family transcriptional repressor for pyruvate dehydrogenase complex